MAQTRWYRERKGEAFYRRAKREGYRARSAYKLKQIQERFEVSRKGDTVVDLGASPGGWSQVAAELAGPNGLVVGVDLEPGDGERAIEDLVRRGAVVTSSEEFLP